MGTRLLKGENSRELDCAVLPKLLLQGYLTNTRRKCALQRGPCDSSVTQEHRVTILDLFSNSARMLEAHLRRVYHSVNMYRDALPLSPCLLHRYYQEVDVLGNWLLRELQDNRTPPLFEVTESESETSENDNKAERQPQMQKSKAENETDIARALCDIWRRAPVAARQERACV